MSGCIECFDQLFPPNERWLDLRALKNSYTGGIVVQALVAAYIRVGPRSKAVQVGRPKTKAIWLCLLGTTQRYAAQFRIVIIFNCDRKNTEKNHQFALWDDR